MDSISAVSSMSLICSSSARATMSGCSFIWSSSSRRFALSVSASCSAIASAISASLIPSGARAATLAASLSAVAFSNGNRSPVCLRACSAASSLTNEASPCSLSWTVRIASSSVFLCVVRSVSALPCIFWARTYAIASGSSIGTFSRREPSGMGMLTVSGSAGRRNASSACCLCSSFSVSLSIRALASSLLTPRARLPPGNSRSRVAPTIPPIVASSPTPPKVSAAALYCCSLRFCKTPDAASCAASNPPDTKALCTFCPRVSTTSGPILFARSVKTGTSIALINLPKGNTSRRPIGAARRTAEDLSSSVAPAARARSLASPDAAPTPNAPAIPVATRVGAPA